MRFALGKSFLAPNRSVEKGCIRNNLPPMNLNESDTPINKIHPSDQIFEACTSALFRWYCSASHEACGFLVEDIFLCVQSWGSLKFTLFSAHQIFSGGIIPFRGTGALRIKKNGISTFISGQICFYFVIHLKVAEGRLFRFAKLAIWRALPGPILYLAGQKSS